jgi:hypothetical protein
LATLAGRNVIASTWQEFFHDRPGAGLWAELRDKRRIIGQVTNASDSGEESVVVLAWPHIISTEGHPVAMGLDAILLDTNDCTLVGVLPDSALPNRTRGVGERLLARATEFWERTRGVFE